METCETGLHPPRNRQTLQVAGQFFEVEDLSRPIDWRDLFGLAAEVCLPVRQDGDGEPAVEVEVGCGNGRFLRRAAQEHPDRLYLGIERSLRYARLARDRMAKYGIPNVRIVRADATRLLATHVKPGSVDALHVYFTDPWPKRRHAKRRLFQTPFFETMRVILRPGAPVFVKVDLFWHFEEVLCRFERSPHFRVVANGTESDPDRDLDELTGFEQKALSKKRRVFFITAERL